MRLVTVEEMRALERAAIDAGTPDAVLMARAGAALAEAAAHWLISPRGKSLLVLVGKGNNGGDALIAARHLKVEHGMRVQVYLAAARADDPLLEFAGGEDTPVVVHDRATGRTLRAWLRDADVVLDGLLGIGATLPVRGAVAEILEACAQVQPDGQRRIAVDLPTGVDGNTGRADEARAFRAQLTLATGPAKPGHFLHPGAAFAGRVRTLDIGISAAASGARPLLRVDAALVASLLPGRGDDSHKGTFGKALVVAGSARYQGAAYLAAAAAVRAGAGLVTLASPGVVQQAVAARSAETTYLPLADDPAAPGALTPGHLGPLMDAALAYDAVAIGPGIGTDPATQRLVRLLLERLAVQNDAPPVVIDADALNALAAGGEWTHPPAPRWVLTPHPGEMGRLTGLTVREVQGDRLGLARARASEWGQVMLLKGAPSVIAAPDGSTWLSGFANAALATAGAGDVLTGTICALLAQGAAPAEAAVAASYVHGLAAELWRHRHGAAGLAVSHLAELLPDALAHLRRQG